MYTFIYRINVDVVINWVPYESPTHVRVTASSLVDADLMVSVGGAGFASANLQKMTQHALWTPAWTGFARMLARGTQWVVLSAASAQESDAESNASPQSIVQLGSCTLRTTSAACAVVAEP